MFKKRATIIKGLILFLAIGILASLAWAGVKITKKRATKNQTEIQKELKEAPETTTTTEIQKESKESTETTTTTDTTTTTEAVDTSNWLTYKNEKYGFEIKHPPYPPTRKVISYDEKTQKEITEEVPISQIDEFDEGDRIEIRLPVPEETLAVEKWLEITIKKIDHSKKCPETKDIPFPYGQETVYIGGIKFEKVKGDEGGMGKSIGYTRYSTLKENKCISITLVSIISMMYPTSKASFYEKQIRQLESDDDKLLDQILSTFKFTK